MRLAVESIKDWNRTSDPQSSLSALVELDKGDNEDCFWCEKEIKNASPCVSVTFDVKAIGIKIGRKIEKAHPACACEVGEKLIQFSKEAQK
jgi:hypothetical protein